MSRWNVLEFRLGTEKTYHVASCHTISHPKVTSDGKREVFEKPAKFSLEETTTFVDVC